MEVSLNRTNFLACLFIFFCGLTINDASAQGSKETAAQMVEIGDEIFNQTLAVMEARDLYITAVNMDGENVRANYMAGVTTLQSIDKGSAKQYFLRVLELDPEYSFDILYKIGQAYHFDYEFDDAINYYSRYKQKLAGSSNMPAAEFATADEAERKIYECEQGKIMVEFPENVEIANVGPEINSDMADYAPVVNQQETMLIFTSRRKKGNLNPDVASDNYPFEDIFVSTKTGTTWSVAENIGQPINTLYHDSNVGLSKDGNSLYIYKDDNGGDIFEAKRDETGQWSEPKPMGKPINTAYAETTVSLTPDGNTLFFASNREGGIGGLDIWLTHKDKKGNWDDPINLGSEINTPYDEDGPFIGYDGKTLFFSSAGGEGMGGFDIYRVVYDSAANGWEAPENMGYPINTPDHDIYFVPTKDGKDAFYSSVRDDGYGNSDIYMLRIPEVLQHQEQTAKPTVTLKVQVYDDNNDLVDAMLQLSRPDGSEKLTSSRTAKGEYNFVSGSSEARDLQLMVSSGGFESQQLAIVFPAVGEESSSISKSVTLSRTQPPPPPVPPVVVRKPTTGGGTKLRNIYFSYNRSFIKKEYNDKVDKAAEYLKSHPSEKILLVGHSDLIGAEKYNIGLSKKRASNVKKALVAKGIAASRIQIKGEGYKYPLASNDQEKEGRELNRRVEFKILR
jgi:outer membrane protein OmpA-like peptidoglycan-associated protein